MLRILNKVECSPFKGEKGHCLEDILFSVQLPQSCLCSTIYTISLLLSENEILCQVLNLCYSKYLLSMLLSGVNKDTGQKRLKRLTAHQ